MLSILVDVNRDILPLQLAVSVFEEQHTIIHWITLVSIIIVISLCALYSHHSGPDTKGTGQRALGTCLFSALIDDILGRDGKGSGYPGCADNVDEQR